MKLTKLLLELFLENNTKIVKWLGNEGLYTPGMQGLDGVKAHLLDIPQEEVESEKYSNLDRADQYVVLGLSLESLTTGQLLILALANYQGTRLDDLPDFIRKFSIDDKWFTLDENQIEEVYSTLSKGVNYFIDEPKAVEDWPFWLRSLVVSRFNQQAGFAESRLISELKRYTVLGDSPVAMDVAEMSGEVVAIPIDELEEYSQHRLITLIKKYGTDILDIYKAGHDPSIDGSETFFKIDSQEGLSKVAAAYAKMSEDFLEVADRIKKGEITMFMKYENFHGGRYIFPVEPQVYNSYIELVKKA